MAVPRRQGETGRPHGKRPYHHGALKQALLREAAEAIRESGPAAVSLRRLARRIGVSHAASTYHFGDKVGLLTALAAEGYRMLTSELESAYRRTRSYREVGVAYVRFAVANRAHFAVMYRPELYRGDDPELKAAVEASGEMLYGPLRDMRHGEIREGAAQDGAAGFDPATAGIAAWSLVHGLATLYLNGNLPAALGDDPERIAREAASYLFASRR